MTQDHSTETDADRPAASWVQKTPDVCGGDACIRRTRIPVWLLVRHRQLGCPTHGFATVLTPRSARPISKRHGPTTRTTPMGSSRISGKMRKTEPNGAPV